jgi:hypothetical protein
MSHSRRPAACNASYVLRQYPRGRPARPTATSHRPREREGPHRPSKTPCPATDPHAGRHGCRPLWLNHHLDLPQIHHRNTSMSSPLFVATHRVVAQPAALHRRSGEATAISSPLGPPPHARALGSLHAMSHTQLRVAMPHSDCACF